MPGVDHRTKPTSAALVCALALTLAFPGLARAETTSPTPSPSASGSASASASSSASASAPEATITGLYQSGVVVGKIQPSATPYDVAWSVDNRQGTKAIVITQVEFGPITTDDADCDRDFAMQAPVQVLDEPLVVDAGTVANPDGAASDPFVQDAMFRFESDDLCRDLEVTIPVRIVYQTLEPGESVTPEPTDAARRGGPVPTSSTDPSTDTTVTVAAVTTAATTPETQPTPTGTAPNSPRSAPASLADTGAPASIVPLAVIGTLLASAGAIAITMGRRR